MSVDTIENDWSSYAEADPVAPVADLKEKDDFSEQGEDEHSEDEFVARMSAFKGPEKVSPAKKAVKVAVLAPQKKHLLCCDKKCASCEKAHDIVEFAPEKCSFGKECARKDDKKHCLFRHPDESAFEVAERQIKKSFHPRPCNYGAVCNRKATCWFLHPNEPLIIVLNRCRDGFHPERVTSREEDSIEERPEDE